MTSDLETALERALENALRAPAVPAELHARVLAAIAREAAPDWQRARRELEDEYRRSIAALNARYLRRGRDVLLAGSTLVILIGLGVEPLAQALRGLFETAAPLVAGVLALGMGLVCGAVLVQELCGRRSDGMPRARRFTA
jgi:regulator of extracellular matrix RemA (YlzA/DUF370 family)